MNGISNKPSKPQMAIFAVIGLVPDPNGYVFQLEQLISISLSELDKEMYTQENKGENSFQT